MGLWSFIAILITAEGQLKKCVWEAPLWRQAGPTDQINSCLANLHLYEGCVDRGPSWLPTVSGHWLRANNSSLPQCAHHIHPVFKSINIKWHCQQVTKEYIQSIKTFYLNKIGSKRSKTSPKHPSGFIANYPAWTFTLALERKSLYSIKMGHLKKLSILSHGCSPNCDTSWQEITYLSDSKPRFFSSGGNFTDSSWDEEKQVSKLNILVVTILPHLKSQCLTCESRTEERESRKGKEGRKHLLSAYSMPDRGLAAALPLKAFSIPASCLP